MDAAVTLVWIAPSPPDADQGQALTSWERAHGVRIVEPRDEAIAGLAVDPRIADDVERLLDRARDAMASRDGEGVDRALAAAESTLAAHPEVPQAAWQMAEVLRARSVRLRRIAPVDEAKASEAWTRAEALDGGRVAGVGEQASASPAAATVAVSPWLPAGAELRVDGSIATARSLPLRAGPHALVVEIDGTPVWASWIDAPAGASSTTLTIPPLPACTRSDLSRASEAGASIDATGVRCPSWIAAVPGDADGVRVATCSADHCGPLLAWHAPLPWTYDPTGERTSKSTWPAWATWSLVGAGAVVTTGIVILATGVLKPAPTETQFVTGGVKTQ
jgi:hypothetical protein